MGNKVLIIFIATFIVLVSIVMMIRQRSSNLLDLSINSFNSLQAEYIANSGMNVYLNKLRFNKNLRGEFDNINLLGGNYSVKISGTDSVVIKVVSEFMSARSNISATVKWSSVSIPPMKAGLSISS